MELRTAIRKLYIVAFILIGLVVLAFCWELRFNFTSSIPVGIYHVVDKEPARGDVVLARLNKYEKLAQERDYVLNNNVIGKFVAALNRDTVIVSDTGVYINGARWPQSQPLKFDRKQRLLPTFRDTLVLHQNEFFLMGEHPRSFDSRYLGIFKGSDLQEVVTPILTRN